MTPEHTQLLSRLQIYLSAQMGESVQITDAKPLAGGASRDTWLFTIQHANTVEKIVLRRDLPSQMFDEALTREQEYRLMDAAYQHGVKVAKMRYLCTDTTVLGSPFFIMDYVEGISIGRKVITAPELAAARQALPQQMAIELAKIHSLNYQGLDFLQRPPDGHSAASSIVEQVYWILDSLGVQNPTWEWTLRWASQHLPSPQALCFIHGDFRLGNLLVNEQGLSAVIDWEFGHLGNPDEELGYLCMRDWRFGNGQARAAGLTDRETFLQVYENASGRTVDRSAVDWWEIVGNIRWGVICMSQAQRHLSGAEQSVELASLGRRSAEMQLEALRLIEALF